MPFYDEFDLSTVDVLLISQYVYACSAFSRYLLEGLAHHCSRESHALGPHPTQHLVYQNQWNIICILRPDTVMCFSFAQSSVHRPRPPTPNYVQHHLQHDSY